MTKTAAPHIISRQARSMGTTAAVCSCGVSSAPTNRPQHLSRWERAHLAMTTTHSLELAR